MVSSRPGPGRNANESIGKSETHPIGGLEMLAAFKMSLGSPSHLAHVLRSRHEEYQLHSSLGHGVVLRQEAV